MTKLELLELLTSLNIPVEGNKVSAKLLKDALGGVHQHPHAIWFQQSDKPEIKAVVNRVSDQYQWSIYRQPDERSAETLVMEGYKPTLPEAKKEVFKIFEDAAQLDKLMSAKPIRR